MRQKRASGRWADPARPEFEPCWVVRFALPKQKPRTESSRLPVCELCLAVPAAENPARVRPRCRCLRPVTDWAAARLGLLAGLWQQGRIEEMEAVLRPREVVSIGRLVDTYEANVPERQRRLAKGYVGRLKGILEQVTGKSWAECRAMPVTILTKALVLDWMRLRQAWNLDRERPEKDRRTWAELRAALALAKEGRRPDPDGEAEGQARGLPGLVVDLPLPGNYTINTNYASARSLVGKKARSHFLPGLELPALSFGEVSMIAAKRGSGAEQGVEAVDAILALGEHWRRHDVEKWIAYRLMISCGMRGVEVLWARRSWIQEGTWMDDEGARWQGWALVVRNYPEDPPLNPGGKVHGLQGFWMKARQADKPRIFQLPADLLEVLLPREGLLVAPGLKYTARENLIRREMSQALRPLVGAGSKGTNHSLRKLSISTVADREGMAAAAAHGGHTEAVAEMFYARSRQSLRVVTDADLRGSGADGRSGSDGKAAAAG